MPRSKADGRSAGVDVIAHREAASKAKLPSPRPGSSVRACTDAAGGASTITNLVLDASSKKGCFYSQAACAGFAAAGAAFSPGSATSVFNLETASTYTKAEADELEKEMEKLEGNREAQVKLSFNALDHDGAPLRESIAAGMRGGNRSANHGASGARIANQSRESIRPKGSRRVCRPITRRSTSEPRR